MWNEEETLEEIVKHFLGDRTPTFCENMAEWSVDGVLFEAKSFDFKKSFPTNVTEFNLAVRDFADSVVLNYHVYVISGLRQPDIIVEENGFVTYLKPFTKCFGTSFGVIKFLESKLANPSKR
jgi:hypothetical protein